MSLNLIPNPKIKQVRLRESLIIGRNYAWLFSAIALILIVLTRLITSEFNQRIEALQSAVQPPLVAQTRDLNRRLDVIFRIFENHVSWSRALNQINAATPESISLQTLTLDNSTSLMILNGRAATRDDLLRYRDRLQELTFLENVDLPLENLFERENVSFQISAKINTKLLR